MLKRCPGPVPEAGTTESAVGKPPVATVKVPIWSHPVLAPLKSEAYMKMLRCPLKVALKLMVSERIIDNPEFCTDAAPMEHWPLEIGVLEVTDLVVAPVRLSYSSCTVARTES